MTNLTPQQKWEAILVKCGFHLVDDMHEFATKICPPTLDNLFEIGVKGYKERRLKLFKRSCGDSRAQELMEQNYYGLLKQVAYDIAIREISPAQALLEALHKALVE